MYGLVENNEIKTIRTTLPIAWRHVSGLRLLSDADLEKLGWYKVVVTNPSHNPDNQVKEGPVDTFTGTNITRVFTVRDMTAEELAQRQAAVDDEELGNATKLIAFILVHLIRKLVTNGTIDPAVDFTPGARAAYNKLKTLVLRRDT